MRKLLLALAILAGAAHAQVIGLTPTYLNQYFWNTSTNQFDPCPNSSTGAPFASTAQGIVLAGWNAGLMQWTPQTSCGGGSGSGLTSFQGRTTAAAVLLLSDVNTVLKTAASCNIAGGYVYSPYSNTCILGGGSFTAAGDLSGNSSSQTVVGIQGKAVVSTAPTNGQVLQWNTGLSEYVPSTLALGLNQLTGDVTAGPGTGSQVATLATVNGAPGTCGDSTHVCQITTNGKGLTTSQTQVAITGGGAVSSVSNSDSSLTVTPTTGAVVASINPAHANTWTAPQTFAGSGPPITIPANKATSPSAGTGQIGTDASGNLVKSDNNGAQIPFAGVQSSAVGNCVEWAANGRDLANAGVTCTGGFSAKIKYVSQIAGCHEDADLNDPSVGTDDTACINTVLATATPTNPVQIVIDGQSKISAGGLHGPAQGNWGITGLGGGITQVQITQCAITGGVATLTTLPNSLTVGEKGTFGDMITGDCATLTNHTFTVLASGLTSTQFKVSASGSQSTTAENGRFVQAFGTGFILADGSDDAISNGPFGTPGSNCDIGAGNYPSRGANIYLANFVLNGNAPNQTTYCFGADINNINNLTINDVVFFNASKYSVKMSNVSQVKLDGNKYYSTTPPIGTETDGIHIEGPASDIAISNSYFKTSDDAIALNAVEGYCGPISRVEIDNSTAEQAFSMLRAYNTDANTCPVNGVVPLIDSIDINNYSGSVTNHAVIFGLGGGGASTTGTLFPAISNFHWNNSTVTMLGSHQGVFDVYDNVGDLALTNFSVVAKDSSNKHLFDFFNQVIPPVQGNFSFNNLKWTGTATGNAFERLLDWGSAIPIASISLDGFSLMGNGVTPTTVFCLMCPASIATQTAATASVSNIDMTHITTLFGGTPSDIIPSIYQSVTGLAPLISSDGITQTMASGLTLPSSRYGTAGAFDAIGDGYQFHGAGPLGHCLVGNGTAYVDSSSCGSGYPQVTSLIDGSGGSNSAGLKFLASGGSVPAYMLNIVGNQLANTLNMYFNGSNWVYGADGAASAFRLAATGSGGLYQVTLAPTGTAGANVTATDTTNVTQLSQYGSSGNCTWFNSQTGTPDTCNYALQLNPAKNFKVDFSGNETSNSVTTANVTDSALTSGVPVCASTGGLLANCSGSVVSGGYSVASLVSGTCSSTGAGSTPNWKSTSAYTASWIGTTAALAVEQGLQLSAVWDTTLVGVQIVVCNYTGVTWTNPTGISVAVGAIN